MSWYANTLFPVLEDVVKQREEVTLVEVTERLERAKNHEVARYVSSMSQNQLDELLSNVWNARSQETESGWAEHDYEEAYRCK